MLHYTSPALAEQHRHESLLDAETRRLVRGDQRRRAPRTLLLVTHVLRAVR